MYHRTHRRAPQRRPLPVGGIFDTAMDMLIGKMPPLAPEQEAVLASWPKTEDKYNIDQMREFVRKLLDELAATMAKVSSLTARKSVLGFGPSSSVLSKVADVEHQINPVVVRMAKRMTFINSKAKEGFTVVQFPNLRSDVAKLMALTHRLDVLVELDGGPTWIGTGLLGVVEAFTRTGAWIVDTTVKVAKPIIALLSNADMIVWGGLGILGVVWWKKRKQT
jgi:hypothetical protein